jgi:nitrogen regulatory protein PII-like uncharacterized protein
MEQVQEDSQKMFDYIIVIESVREQDTKIGKEVFDSIIKRKCDQMGVGALYYFVNDLEELKQQFYEIAYLAQHHDKIPMVHIEAHGSEEYIELASGEKIHWGVLGIMLSNTNVFSKNNVALVLSCCHGINMIRGVNLLTPVPCYLLIAPEGEPNEPDLQSGFAEFYEVFLDGLSNYDYGASFSEAMRKLNENKSVPFYYMVSKSRFEGAWNEFRQQYDTPEKIVRVINKWLEKAVLLGTTTPEQVRQFYLSTLSNDETIKVMHYKKFMMLQ